MKLRYIIPSFIAALTLFVSCGEDNDPTYLEEVRVSNSYVSIDQNGGSATITVTANADWHFDKVFLQTSKDADGNTVKTYTELPTWLKVNQISGSAGETQLTFSADGTLDGRTADLHLVCGGVTQHINVIQGLSTISNATCAEVIAGPDSKTYRVTGTCTAIANTTYGNWYLTDETGEIYIYGTLDKNGGTKNFLSWEMEVGDIVTVEGPKTTYNGTVELVDVTVVKIEKSLIKVDSLSTTDPLPLEGGELSAFLICKGNGVSVEIPEDAKDWLSITSITAGSEPVVKFRVAPNAGGDRSTTITFKTTDGTREYTSEAVISQKGAIIAATVAEFLAAEVGNTLYRVTGVISKVANASYGNIYLKDFSGEMYVYGIGSKGDFQAMGLKEGDIVTLVGKRGEYKGDAQMTGAVVDTDDDGNPKVTPVTDITIEEFLTKPDSKTTYYRVTGTISSLKGSNGKDNDYGNLYITDGTNELYVYGCYSGYGATGDARKFFIRDNGIQVGDKLTMIGYKDTYNGLVELCGGICFSFQKAE